MQRGGPGADIVWHSPEPEVKKEEPKSEPEGGGLSKDSIFGSLSKLLGMKVTPEIFPAGTDSRFLRQLGLPAFGFSPLAGSEVMLHEHNEYVDTEVFLRGVPIYEKIILDLASVAPEVPAPASSAAARGGGEAPSKKQRTG